MYSVYKMDYRGAAAPKNRSRNIELPPGPYQTVIKRKKIKVYNFYPKAVEVNNIPITAPVK